MLSKIDIGYRMSDFRGRNKKAQVGDTVMWIVATIAILIIIMFFVFGASTLASTKSIGKYKASLISSSQSENVDVFLYKTVYTYVEMKSSFATKKITFDLGKKYEEGKFSLNYNETIKEVEGRIKEK